jgi:L-lysine exporter family protein LysE/ArgO
MHFFLEGLFLGCAYAMPIGAQNIFVIHSAVKEGLPQSFRTALIVSIMDVSLGVACFMGLGLIFAQLPFLRLALLAGGSAFLVRFSYKLLTDRTGIPVNCDTTRFNTWSVLRSGFVLTWFNPHALIDGSVLFGTYRASLPESGLMPFITGMVIASPLWFFSLTGVMGGFREVLSYKLFRFLNVACAVVMAGFGIKLAYLFVKDVLI